MHSQSPALAAAGQKLHQLNLPPSQLAQLLSQNAHAQVKLFMAGVERYRRHPYRRSLADPPMLWQEGSTRLLDFAPRGRPVLVLPSLINRSTILDLTAQHSLMRFLAAQGLRPLLLDWGAPYGHEQHFSLSDYVQRAGRALDFIGEAVPVIGYCMGGTLAVALAALYPAKVQHLALLATPWDFHTPLHKAKNQAGATLFGAGLPLYQSLGVMPVDALQSHFTLLDPLASVQKFSRFAGAPDDENAAYFVAVEDWLNDGIPLALPAAREVLQDWYGQNHPAAGSWIAKASAVRCPVLVMIAEADKIVPPESAAALVQQLPHCTKIQLPLGHIGLIVSRSARAQTWEKVAQWARM